MESFCIPVTFQQHIKRLFCLLDIFFKSVVNTFSQDYVVVFICHYK